MPEETLTPSEMEEAAKELLGHAAATDLMTEFEPNFPITPLPPLLLRASGLYATALTIPPTKPIPVPVPFPPPIPKPGPVELAGGDPSALILRREDLRLDVDGRYPQMTASGTLFRGISSRLHWVANLTPAGTNSWTGTIWYKDGDAAALPYTQVRISVVRSLFINQRKATAVFSGGGSATRTVNYNFVSFFFDRVEFEFDQEEGATGILSIDTHAHPTRPASLPAESLSIVEVFRRTGFDASASPNVSTIPTDGPDTNDTWSDAEMHDAMQTYWSRFSNTAQWSMWVLFARQHDTGASLGGVMFDDIGPAHRQGTAIFTNSFITVPPAGDPAPDAWVNRMIFWTAVHEMGHAFNLAHSWQKHLGTPWIPIASDDEARSFMNYPFRVQGRDPAFFSSFDYRFSDQELLFLRHAPRRFVQMGNADWFDNHGFEQAETDPAASFTLEIKVEREKGLYEFLEPVMVELTLTNRSDQPHIVPEDLLEDSDHMIVVLKRDGHPARRWAPFARYCRKARMRVLQPGESLTANLFVSAGLNGWDLAEPGRYLVQMALEVDEAMVVSNPLRLRVAPPKGYEEELLAQDVFTDEAGRVMALDGSRVLESGINAWRSVAERLPHSRAALHAQICLTLPEMQPYRLLEVTDGGKGGGHACRIRVAPANPEAGRESLQALARNSEFARATLGSTDFAYYSATMLDLVEDAAMDKGPLKDAADALRKVGASSGRKARKKQDAD